jgi:hypothetical protein
VLLPPPKSTDATVYLLKSHLKIGSDEAQNEQHAIDQGLQTTVVYLIDIQHASEVSKMETL